MTQKIVQKTALLSVFFLQKSAFAEETKSDAIIRGLGKAFEAPPWMAPLILLLGAGTMFAVYRYFRLAAIQERRLREDQERENFESLVEEKQLDEADITLIRRLAKLVPEAPASRLLASHRVYDAALRRYQETGATADTLASIQALRAKLGFTKTGFAETVSHTQQLEPNQRLRVMFDDLTSFEPYLGSISEVTHDGIGVVLMYEEGDQTPEVRVGQQVSVTLWRQRDGQYEFTTTVESIENLDPPVFTLAHTPHLNRTQTRGFLRTKVQLPVKVVEEDKDHTRIGKMADGTLVDLSGGGARMAALHAAKPGTRLVLKNLVLGTRQMPPLVSRVVTCEEQSNGFYHLGLEFSGLLERERESIIRYVFKQQAKERNAHEKG